MMHSKRSALRLFVLFALTFLVAGAPRAQAASSIPPTAPSHAPTDLLQFTSGGHMLGFTPLEIYVASGSHALRVEFVDATPVTPLSATPQGETGRAAALGQVTYANLWRGITLSYDAPNGSIARSTYRLEPFANVQDIRLRYNAPVRVDEAGNLRIAFETGELTESAPIAWQEIDGQRVAVQIAFRLIDSSIENQKSKIENVLVGFTISAYDQVHPLYIDPTFKWSTFLGGSGDDEGNDIAVDGSGNVYVTGRSTATWGCSPTACTVRAFISNLGNPNAFAAKLDSSGNLIWNTFLGGGGDVGNDIAVDGSGNVYVTGYSIGAWGCSPTACTVRAYNNASGQNAFVAKLDSSGNLTWNTFLGGNGSDNGLGIAVLGGNVYVAGESSATWGCSPTACTVRPYTASTADGFVAKLDSSGNLTWNTFLGGGGNDYATSIAVDGSGNVYVTGGSDATWGWSLLFPPVRAYTAGNDAFAAKLDSSGNLKWNTFLGGSGYDTGSRIAVEGNGNVYVTGESNAAWGCSPTACTVRAFPSGSEAAFVAKLDSSSGNLSWNTFLGAASLINYGLGIAVDGGGNVYVAGYSWATWGCSPTACTVRAYTAGQDAFAAKLDTSGNLKWNTFLGGGGNDVGYGIAVDTSGNVYVTGYSNATWGSPVRAYTASTADAFVAKLTRYTTTTTITSDTPDPSVVGQAVAVNFSVTSASGTPTGNVMVSDGTVNCTGTVAAGTCALTPTTAGAKTLTATYAGDTDFSGSTSVGVAHQVNAALFLPLIVR